MSEYYLDVIQRKSKSARREGEPARRKNAGLTACALDKERAAFAKRLQLPGRIKQVK